MRGDDKLVRRRSLWIGVLLSAVALVLVGTGAYGASHLGRTTPVMRSVVDAAPGGLGASASITSGAVERVPSHAAPGTALALLLTIPVKGRAPKTGYGRVADFGPAWKDVDRNGCDTRDDILRRDLVGVTARPGTHGCVILAGTLTDPYTGRVIRFVRGTKTSTAVQIDHVVALMNAWQSGARQIGQTRREALANDPLNLLAVDGPANEAKGDGDAATWLPPSKGVRCAYVARQITVKARYRLWVTPAERAAMVRVLGTCPKQPVATAAAIRVPAAVPTRRAPAAAPAEHARVPARPAPGRPAPARPSVVHPGAFCTPAGARGVTAKGTAMVCKTKPGDTRLRWRAP